MRIKNLLLAFRDQGPFTRFCKNLVKGHVLGLFHKRSHFRDTGAAKISYSTKQSATKAAASMAKKTGVWFSNYKCVFCDGYHIGKNRENKT